MGLVFSGTTLFLNKKTGILLRSIGIVNSCMPGMQYDPPSQKKVKNFYDEWENLDAEEKKEKLKIFIAGLLEKHTKFDQYTEFVGVVFPPVAMIMKRVGERSPQLKTTLEFIPDAAFVPLVTIGALITIRLVQKNALQLIMEAFTPINYDGASPQT